MLDHPGEPLAIDYHPVAALIPYVQQSPWLGIANKQLELMGRYMCELGITPASRSRVVATPAAQPAITFTTIYEEDPREILRAKLKTIASRIAPPGAQ